MQAGQVVVPTKDDFNYFKMLITDSEGWTRQYMSKFKSLPITTYTKVVDGNDIKAVKVKAIFNQVTAKEVYESLQDPDFRKTWDEAMREGSRICYVSPNSEIGYYRLKSPFGLKDRDFVNQRSWFTDGENYIIMNHSVAHKKKPPVDGVQRGISYITGYLIRPNGPDTCEFLYMSHSDPRGKIPTWVVNASVKTVAPFITKKLYEAARNYSAWKSTNYPDFRPWSNFEQLGKFPPLDPADVGILNDAAVSKITTEDITESSVHFPLDGKNNEPVDYLSNCQPVKRFQSQ